MLIPRLDITATTNSCLYHMKGPSGGIFVPLLIAQLLLLVTFAIILLGLYYYCQSIRASSSPRYRAIYFPVLFSITVSYGLFFVLGEIVLYVTASLQYPSGRTPQWIALVSVSGSLAVEPILFAKVCSPSSSHIWNAVVTAYISCLVGLSIVLHHAMAWPHGFLLSIFSGTLCMAIVASAMIHTISTHTLPRNEQNQTPAPSRNEKCDFFFQKSSPRLASIVFVLVWGIQSLPSFSEIDSALEQTTNLYLLLLVIIAAMFLQMAEVTFLGWRVHPVFLTAMNALVHESVLCYMDGVQQVPAAIRVARISSLNAALGFIGSGMVLYSGERSTPPHFIEPYNT